MLDSSAGKKLSQARLAKRLTIDEVAHATKLRPDKIVALENDDFSRFGSIAYGKGFLQIYARYLGIDLTEQLRHLEIPDNSVSISDYQYLNTPQAPAPRQRSRPVERGGARHERRPPSVLPLLVVLSLGALGFYGYHKFNVPRVPAPPAPMATPGPEEVVVPPPAAPSAEKPAATTSNVPALARAGRNPGDTNFLATVSPPVSVSPAPGKTVAAEAGAMNEIIVQPLKKVWVKIHTNSPTSPPIFEDYLYPSAPPLKLRGAKFFIEVRDEGAVQIRQNGRPIAYQSPGISIP